MNTSSLTKAHPPDSPPSAGATTRYGSPSTDPAKPSSAAAKGEAAPSGATRKRRPAATTTRLPSLRGPATSTIPSRCCHCSHSSGSAAAAKERGSARGASAARTIASRGRTATCLGIARSRKNDPTIDAAQTAHRKGGLPPGSSPLTCMSWPSFHRCIHHACPTRWEPPSTTRDVWQPEAQRPELLQRVCHAAIVPTGRLAVAMAPWPPPSAARAGWEGSSCIGRAGPCRTRYSARG